MTVGSFPTEGLHCLTSRTVLREVVGSHQLEVVLQVVYSDHAPQELLLLLQMTILGHQHKVVFPEEEGRGEQSGGVERREVEAVEEAGRLALRPAPDEDIVEAVTDVVLDGHQVLLIPVSKIRVFIIKNPLKDIKNDGSSFCLEY